MTGAFGGAAFVAAPATGTHSTVPQGQPTSGRGHSVVRPHPPQRTPTHSSSQLRRVTAVAVPSGSSAGVTGVPHAQG